MRVYYRLTIDNEDTDPQGNQVQVIDPLNSYAVKQVITNTIVVPASPPVYMTREALGLYYLEFTDPATQVLMTYWTKLRTPVVQGNTLIHRQWFEYTPGTGLAWYAGRGDVEDVFGIKNVQIWSNLSDDSASALADGSRISKALAFAHSEILNNFRGGIYSLPLTMRSGEETVRDWAAKLAGIWLYRSRPGNQAKLKKGEAEPYDAMERSIYEDLGRYKVGQKRLDADRVV